MRTFTVNGKTYKAKQFDFNLTCDLEDLGVSLSGGGTNRMSSVRAYVALCAGISVEEAGSEIQAHVVAKGNLKGVIEVMNAEMEESDFFRAINEDEEQETPQTESEETATE